MHSDFLAALPWVIYWILFPTILACLEVQLEKGKEGWAWSLSTWFRIKGWPAWIFARLLGGRPLTGYHLFLFLLLGLIVHLPFAAGMPWSIAAEAKMLSGIFAMSPAWDFLYFQFKPGWGIEEFKPERIKWHEHVIWVFGFPSDYVIGWTLSLVFVGIAAHTDPKLLFQHWMLLGGLALWSALCVGVIGPKFQRWHTRMLATDERHLLNWFPE